VIIIKYLKKLIMVVQHIIYVAYSTRVKFFWDLPILLN